MAREEALRTRTYVAGADLSGNQYFFVKEDTSGNIIAIAANTDRPIGILQNKPTSGRAGTVAVAGVSKLVVSAAVTAADIIGPSANGRAASNPGGGSGVYLVGRARDAATTAGQIISCEFDCEGIPSKA